MPVVLTAAVALLALILVAGVVFGQFRRGVVTELREALETARNEIEIERGRADRLERTVERLEEKVHELEARPDWSQVVNLVHTSEVNIVAAVKQSQLDLLNAAIPKQ